MQTKSQTPKNKQLKIKTPFRNKKKHSTFEENPQNSPKTPYGAHSNKNKSNQ